jgi:hypothetical protein
MRDRGGQKRRGVDPQRVFPRTLDGQILRQPLCATTQPRRG